MTRPSVRRTRAVVVVRKAHYEVLFAERRDSKVRVTAAFRRERSESTGLFPMLRACAVPFSEVTVLLGRDQATVRLLDLPTTDMGEIRDIVSIQAGKFTPFGKDEIAWDCRVIDRERGGYSRVFVGVVQKEKIDALSSGAETLAAREVSFGLDCEALGAWAHSRGRSVEGPYGVIDWTSEGADFSVVASGEVIFTRLLQIDPLDAGTGWVERFVNEARYAIGSYQAEQAGPPVNSVAVHASAEAFERLRAALAGLSVDAFRAPALPPNVELVQDASRTFKELSDSGVTFAKALAAASSGPRGLDFTPPVFKKRIVASRRRRSMALTAALAGLVALSLVSLALEKRFSSLLRLNALARMERKLSAAAGPVAEVDRRIRFVEARLAESSEALGALADVGLAIPADVYLTEVSRDENGTALRGTASDQQGVYTFAKNLETTRHFASVKTLYANKRAGTGREVFDFEIVCAHGRPSA